MLSNTKGKQLIKYVPDYVVFDLETTGLSAETEEVIEISALSVQGGVIVSEFSTLVDPGRHIDYNISAITGIMDDMVAGCPDIKTALSDFLDFAGEKVLVGHNIRNFDLRFIYRDCEKYFGRTLGNDYIDTLTISRIFLPDLDHHGLGDLADHYGIVNEGAHRALNDCKANYMLFERLAEEIAHPSTPVLALRRCPRCGNMLKRRDGTYGPFMGCMSFPDCRYTEKV